MLVTRMLVTHALTRGGASGTDSDVTWVFYGGLALALLYFVPLRGLALLAILCLAMVLTRPDGRCVSAIALQSIVRL